MLESEVMTKEDGIVCHNEDESEVMKMVAMFHLRWSSNQFGQSMDYYITKPSELDPNDQHSYDELVMLINGFSLVW